MSQLLFFLSYLLVWCSSGFCSRSASVHHVYYPTQYSHFISPLCWRYTFSIRVMVIVRRLRGNIIRTALSWVVWHNVHSQQHTYMSSTCRSSRLGLSHWDPYAMHRGGCLELYYCNMVEWSWLDLSLIWKTKCFDTVGLVIWPVKIVPKITYNVLSGTYVKPLHYLCWRHTTFSILLPVDLDSSINQCSARWMLWHTQRHTLMCLGIMSSIM